MADHGDQVTGRESTADAPQSGGYSPTVLVPHDDNVAAQLARGEYRIYQVGDDLVLFAGNRRYSLNAGEWSR